jgi:hypothetical protein
MFDFDSSKIDLNKQTGFSLVPGNTWDEENLDKLNTQAIIDCKFLLGIDIPTGNEVINAGDAQMGQIDQGWLQSVENLTGAIQEAVDYNQVFSQESEASLRAWKRQLKLEAAQLKLRATSEFRPGAVTHATKRASWHSRSVGNEHGMAIDFAGSPANMAAFFDFVRANYAPESIRELIYSPKGQVIRGSFLDYVRNPVTRDDHYDHVHVALGPVIKRVK